MNKLLNNKFTIYFNEKYNKLYSLNKILFLKVELNAKLFIFFIICNLN